MRLVLAALTVVVMAYSQKAAANTDTGKVCTIEVTMEEATQDAPPFSLANKISQKKCEAGDVVFFAAPTRAPVMTVAPDFCDFTQQIIMGAGMLDCVLRGDKRTAR